MERTTPTILQLHVAVEGLLLCQVEPAFFAVESDCTRNRARLRRRDELVLVLVLEFLNDRVEGLLSGHVFHSGMGTG